MHFSVLVPMALLGEPRCTCGSWAQRSPSARSPVESPADDTAPEHAVLVHHIKGRGSAKVHRDHRQRKIRRRISRIHKAILAHSVGFIHAHGQSGSDLRRDDDRLPARIMAGALSQCPGDLGHHAGEHSASKRMGRSGWRRCAKILSISTRYSAAVRVRTVSMRATKHTRPSRMPPRATVVLPISMAKIIILFPFITRQYPAGRRRKLPDGLPLTAVCLFFVKLYFTAFLFPVTSLYKDFVVLAELLHYTKVRNVETVHFCRRFYQWI